MADLRESADGIRAEDVRAALQQQLSKDLDVEYRAAGVGRFELQQLTAAFSGGLQGNAAVEGRVDEADARITAML